MSNLCAVLTILGSLLWICVGVVMARSRTAGDALRPSVGLRHGANAIGGPNHRFDVPNPFDAGVPGQDPAVDAQPLAVRPVGYAIFRRQASPLSP
jgi:hypothetical protein